MDVLDSRGMNKIKVRGRTFAKNLRTLRLARGMTQEGLAKHVGVTRQAIALMEAGGGVSLERVFCLADALGTRIEELVR